MKQSSCIASRFGQLLVILLLWFLETEQSFAQAEPGAVSCKEYKENINARYKLIPNDTEPEERCRRTPAKCGPPGMIFNPSGRQTYYYQSQCYYHLAVSTMNEAQCDKVIERRSLLFNGSFYSRPACAWRASVRSARTMLPPRSMRSRSLTSMR